MDDYLSKPLQPALLLSKLAEIAARLDGGAAIGLVEARKATPNQPMPDLNRLDDLLRYLPPEGVRDLAQF